MIIGLLIILALILVLPFVIKQVEHNLEYFLFGMGLLAVIVSGRASKELAFHVLRNYLLYTITGAVLIAGLLFTIFYDKMERVIKRLIIIIPLKVFIFIVIVGLGLASSIITAIVAALLLVEIIAILPLKREVETRLTIISCFSIGLGATLTPIGEPLSTIVISALNADFFYLLRSLGIFIIPTIIALGAFGAFYVLGKYNDESSVEKEPENIRENIVQEPNEGIKGVLIRAGKIFIFVIALELLGAGFKPLIDAYVINLDSKLLYLINMLSAVLDNATMAAAEISPAMSMIQLRAVLLGLLVSGGMLIPGNIPNIISAGKLKIKSKEWAKVGIPLGLGILAIYFIPLFIF